MLRLTRTALVATATLLTCLVKAQVGTDYGFQTATGTYTQVSGGSTLSGLAANDALSASLNIGFSFTYNGTVYTQFKASSNGWISLGTGASASTPVNNLNSSSPGRPFLAPLWDDLSGAGGFLGIGAGTAVYATTGTAPNRVLTMEWRNWKWDRTMNNLTNTISFQCKLYETSNVIEFVYRQELSGPANTSGGASIGISGTSTGDFLSLNNTGASPTASNATETTNLSGRPVTGQIYRFLPCRPATATISTATDCVAGTHQATIVVTSIGSAPHVDIVGSVSGLIADNVGAGTYTSGAIPNGTSQTFTVVHNGNSVCNLALGTVTNTTCVANGSCMNPGPAIPDNGCGTGTYLEAGIPMTGLPTVLNTTVFLESVDLIVAHTWRGDLRISLISPSGQVRDLINQRPTASAGGNNLGNINACPNTVLKLKDGGSALSTMDASNANLAVGTFAPEQALAGFTGDPNGQWRLRICDAAGSDEGNLRYVKLNFLDCLAPVATGTVVESCANGTFNVSVNVTSTGSGGTVTLSSSLLGEEHNNVGTGTYVMGPYPVGTAVNISVRHQSNAACDQLLGTFRDCCGGVCSSARDAVVGTNTTPAIDCGDGASTGTGTRDARWFKWTAPYAGTINITACSGSPVVDTYLRLHSGACGGLTFLQQDDDGCTGSAGFSRILNRPVTAGTTYYIEWDNRFSSNGFTWQLQFNANGSTNMCAGLPITCGQSISANSTSGAPNTLPAGACPFNGPASTGGTHWWTYTATATGEVTASLCGSASFDTRISVFSPLPDCSTPTCVAMSDDGPGCPGGTSEVRFHATAGSTYQIAVHGSGAAAGTYTLSLFCSPVCAPAAGNDDCASAQALTSVLADGTGVHAAGDNSCAVVDAPTSLSGTGPAVGVWYTFNTGAHARHRLRLAMNGGGYTAPLLHFALYDGACNNMGASGELTVVQGAAASNTLPLLAPNTEHRIFVYNNGSISQAGSFGVLVEHPGLYDAGITEVTAPAGLICGNVVEPVVRLKNFGEATLTAVDLVVSIDGTPVATFPWTGSLAFDAEEVVALPAVNTPAGAHTLTVSVSLPNGAPDEIPANNSAGSSYSADGLTVRVVVRTDANGDQLTWAIYDAFFFPVANGGPFTGQNDQTITTTACLPSMLGSCFSFYLFDAAGDGICCGAGNGFWELRNGTGGLLLRDRFEGGNQSPTTAPLSPGYALGHEFCLNEGPSGILPSECGILTNDLLSKVYTAAVPGALLYQFEFSDPDAGFRRRIAVPRNWVAFGEMVTSPLLPGVVYFARARVDQGATGFFDDRFGTGCEMAINPAAVPGCTQLIDNPLLPTHSCGVVRAFGGSDKIWAQPVVGGTLYKFRFTNTGAGYERTIQSSNYVCVLNWVTQPLVDGTTYQVQVNVLVNGQWSGWCGATCDVTIQNPPQFGGRSMEAAEEQAMPADMDLALYPNPTAGEVVTLRLSGLGDGTHAIALEVFDMTGRQVLARTLDRSGDALTERLEPADLPGAGAYLVVLTADGRSLTKRLIVN